MATKPEIKITQTGLGEILKQFNLKVPSHQRDYSWTDEEVTRLFQDLAKAIADHEPEYFLGSIVTIPDPDGVLEVIDGQQRLATVTILLSEICRYLADKDPFISKSIEGFLMYPDRQERAMVPKLRLNLVDNAFFSARISSNATNSAEAKHISHRLICAAFDNAKKQIKNIVSGYDVKAHGDILNKWVGFIESSAEVILLRVPTGRNAYKMFETLNGRGIDTTQADLVKNYLFGQADARLSEVQDSWSLIKGAMETVRGDKDLTVTFLRHALIVIQGNLREDDVYEAVQKQAKGSQSSVTFLKQIESLSGVYVATFYSDHEKWSPYADAMRQALQTVNFFNIHPFRPVLLAIAAKFTIKEAPKAFQMFVSLGVRLIIASSTRSGSIEETLSIAAHKIFTDKITTTPELKKEISGIIPSDEQFRQSFEIATVSKGPFARYYLRALERAAKNQPEPWFTVNDDKEVITLEHVLPEKPEGNWPEFTEEELETYHRRIGNMVLLQKKTNSDLKSAGFDIKKPTYKNCPYALTAMVSKLKKWNVEMISKRQKTMADLALKAWPI